MAKRLTLTQAQDRLIKRVTAAHKGHQKRVLTAARKQLFAWAIAGGYTQDDAIIVCNDACGTLSLILNEKDFDEESAATAATEEAAQNTPKGDSKMAAKAIITETQKEPAAQTYKVRRLDYTNWEFEVMALADLHAVIKARLDAGEDPEDDVSYVCIKHDGQLYWGVGSVGHGTNAELRNGLDVEMWWDPDWAESADDDDDGDYVWLDDYKTV